MTFTHPAYSHSKVHERVHLAHVLHGDADVVPRILELTLLVPGISVAAASKYLSNLVYSYKGMGLSMVRRDCFPLIGTMSEYIMYRAR